MRSRHHRCALDGGGPRNPGVRVWRPLCDQEASGPIAVAVVGQPIEAVAMSSKDSALAAKNLDGADSRGHSVVWSAAQQDGEWIDPVTVRRGKSCHALRCTWFTYLVSRREQRLATRLDDASTRWCDATRSALEGRGYDARVGRRRPGSGLLAHRRCAGKDWGVTALTRQPDAHGHIGDVMTTRGGVSVLLSDNPTLLQPPFFYTHVALADWMPPDRPVVMFVTFMAMGERREVNLVYAPGAVRFDELLDGHESVPVQIGKWLFAGGHLTHHSVDRTPEGDRWASVVGGDVPPLAPADDPRRGNPEATTRRAERAYAALCATDWSRHWHVA